MGSKMGQRHASTKERIQIYEYLGDKIAKLKDGVWKYLSPYSDRLIAEELNLLNNTDHLTAAMVAHVRIEMFGNLQRGEAGESKRMSWRVRRDIRHLQRAIDTIIGWARENNSASCNKLADELCAIFNEPEKQDPDNTVTSDGA